MSSTQSGAKLFIAFAALGGALLLAHPYRLDGTKRTRRASSVAQHVVLRETGAPSDAEIVLPDAPTAEIQRTLLTPPPESAELQQDTEVVERLAPPPAMARTYPGSSSMGDTLATSNFGLSQRTKQRTHVVHDGDTLESLAQLYLGDRSRWREIWNLNRNKIGRPELLPLGTRLLVPPRFPKPSGTVTDQVRSSAMVQIPATPPAP